MFALNASNSTAVIGGNSLAISWHSICPCPVLIVRFGSLISSVPLSIFPARAALSHAASPACSCPQLFHATPIRSRDRPLFLISSLSEGGPKGGSGNRDAARQETALRCAARGRALPCPPCSSAQKSSFSAHM